MIKNNNKAVSQPAPKMPVVQATKESIENNRILEEMKALRIKTDTVIPPELPILSIDSIPIFEKGDIAAIKGKQKNGKTTVLKAMVGAWMKGELFRLKSEKDEAKVLWLDTEQKRQDVRQIVYDICQMTGLPPEYIDSHLMVYTVRKLPQNQLLDRTELLISSYKPDVVIVDGTVDLVKSFNDEEESHTLINKLIVLCDQYHCSIINVLHENKSGDDHNMRGHLGTMMAQKASTVLQCKKENNIIKVSCSDSRHRAMPDWFLTYDANGHIVDPQDTSTPVLTPAQKVKKDRQEIIKAIIQEKGGQISRRELTEALMQKLKLKRPTVSNFITKQVDGLLMEVNDMIQLAPELPFIE